MRKFNRPKIARRKARRVSEVNTRRINKRKYYGLGVEIDEFKETLEYHFTHSSMLDAVDDSIASVESVSEDAASDIANSASLLRGSQEDVLEDLKPTIESSADKGSRRAFDSRGDTLPKPDSLETEVQNIVDEQRNYISKLDEDLRSAAIAIISAGVAEGLSKAEIKSRLRSRLKGMIDNRSSTVANSEVVKAGVAGTVATFAANDVDSVTWVSSQDSRVCEPGNFRVTINGTTYTSCRELDGESFDLPRFPRPVLASHPNCRCVLVANND